MSSREPKRGRGKKRHKKVLGKKRGGFSGVISFGGGGGTYDKPNQKKRPHPSTWKGVLEANTQI